MADENVVHVHVCVAGRAEYNCGHTQVWMHKMVCDYLPGPAAGVPEVEGLVAKLTGGAFFRAAWWIRQ